MRTLGCLGWMGSVHNLCDVHPISANVRYYCLVLLSYSKQRWCKKLCLSIPTQTGSNSSWNPLEGHCKKLPTAVENVDFLNFLVYQLQCGKIKDTLSQVIWIHHFANTYSTSHAMDNVLHLQVLSRHKNHMVRFNQMSQVTVDFAEESTSKAQSLSWTIESCRLGTWNPSSSPLALPLPLPSSGHTKWSYKGQCLKLLTRKWDTTF